ncbi:MAG TPA: PAAR-like domain-containing protein [Myxococcota bacterium]|nr:PAAR-like domain-containing protein [Myxococcota bacterium]
MGNDVYANNMNVACKAGDGKVICAFPDVCLSPPTPPAGPIPIPYPVTSMSSDTTDGSGTVTVNNKEVMLKDKSCYSKCTGDEAATKTLGMGVANASLSGKVYFKMWSMDVQMEGENVVRAFDITTSNHMSEVGNAAVPMINSERMGFTQLGECKGVNKKFELVPYESTNPSTGDKDLTCGRKGMTGHHLIPGRCMKTRTTAGGNAAYPKGCSHDKAPCVCVDNENQYDGTHKECHAIFDPIEQQEAKKPPKDQMTYKKARDTAAESAAGINGGKDLTDKQLECVKAQLDNYYKKCLANQDGSIALNSPLNAQADNSGLVLPSTSSVGGLGSP